MIWQDDHADQSGFDKSRYKGYLVCADIRGALDYLDACGETARAQALRQRLVSPPGSQSGIILADRIIDAYHRYFQNCFAPVDATTAPKTREPAARNELEKELRMILHQPDRSLDDLEQALTGIFNDLGLSYLGGRTCGYYGPYIWRETAETTYEVEIPSGKEHVVVHWMDGFISRSWLDWLSGGEYGAGGWAGSGGLYCVKSAYKGELETPTFTISFLKHEAQHQADYRYGEMSARDLEYRAKLVELIFYQDPSFLHALLASGDPSDKDNSHAYAAAMITDRLSRYLGARFQCDGMNMLNQAARTMALWNNFKENIQKGAAYLLEEHTVLVKKACAARAFPIEVI